MKRFRFWILAVVSSWGLVSAASSGAEAEEKDAYADEPYWYQPGHPLQPAEDESVEALPGFRVERLLTVPEDIGSWVSLCVDGRGRLIASAQHKPGLYRIWPAEAGGESGETRIERLGGAAAEIGWSHGMLYAFDSLYVTVSEANERLATGVYRLRDADGDDQFEVMELLFELDGAGEHGPHGLVVGPEGRRVHMICGNATAPPDMQLPPLPVATDGIDHLLPPGFASSRHTPACFVLSFDPDGGRRRMEVSGMRNAYDLAFNLRGDLFTFDSDMEWDLGTPWYRPTRICHLVRGGELGWREDGAVWPEHFEDSVAPVLNVGPSSPTGVVFGYRAHFPERYRRALFVCDWTFGAIHAVHMEPAGGSYEGHFEEFVGGMALPVTDVVIGSDGAMYFTVGGRRLGSAMYRVAYVGEDVSEGALAPAAMTEEARLRRRLEALHANPSLERLDEMWDALGHEDRAVRFAARVALEKLPVVEWPARALEEGEVDRQLMALLALARQGEAEHLRQTLETLAGLNWEPLSPRLKLLGLRACEVALARGGVEMEVARADLLATLRPLFSRQRTLVNHEVGRLLCYLGDAAAIDTALRIMEEDRGQQSSLGLDYYARNPKYGKAIRDMLLSAPMLERMSYAKMLLWIQKGWSQEQRVRYFELMEDALQSSQGGHWYTKFWNDIRGEAYGQLDEETRKRVAYDPEAVMVPSYALDLPEPMGPGRDWTVATALATLAEEREQASAERGERAYAAARCIVCHRVGGEGGGVGPDLSTIAQRFSTRDILEAIIHPSRAMSDQYQMTVVTMEDGEVYSGRVVANDGTHLQIATNAPRPGETTRLPVGKIRSKSAIPVSTMPEDLIDGLSGQELADLMAYLLDGGE